MLTLNRNNTPEFWVKTLEALREKESAYKARAVELSSERKEYQLEASLGDTASQEKLNQLTREARTIETQLEDNQGAIEQASLKLAEAQDAEQKAKNQSKAQEIKGLVAKLRTAGQATDYALIEAAKALQSQHMLAKELADLIASSGKESRLQALNQYLITERVFGYHGLTAKAGTEGTPSGPKCSMSDLLDSEQLRKALSIAESLE